MMKIKISRIIFIVADTSRARSFGLYGRTPSPTPNIDKLGQKGALFLNMYGSITKTDPSISAMMTGKYPISLGLISHGKWLRKEQEKLAQESLSLPEILKKKGYFTAAVDWLFRWHTKGYDYYSGKLIKDVDLDRLIKDNIFFLRYLRFLDVMTVRLVKRDFFVRFPYCFFEKTTIPYDPADIVTDEAIKILEKQKDHPLFLYLHFRDAHFPHIRPKGLKSYLFDSLESRYEAEIRFMDEQIGRLLSYLEKNDQLKETLIVFTADHGENLCEHGMPIAHRTLFEEVIKIPLVVYHPDLPSVKIKAFVQHPDILPTILELLEIPFPKGIDGESLLPLMLGRTKKFRKFAFFEDISFGELRFKKSRRKRGLRKGNFKYIETLKGKDDDLFSIIPSKKALIESQELYDLVNDSQERKNLFSQEPRLGKKLQKELEDFVAFLQRKHHLRQAK